MTKLFNLQWKTYWKTKKAYVLPIVFLSLCIFQFIISFFIGSKQDNFQFNIKSKYTYLMVSGILTYTFFLSVLIGSWAFSNYRNQNWEYMIYSKPISRKSIFYSNFLASFVLTLINTLIIYTFLFISSFLAAGFSSSLFFEKDYKHLLIVFLSLLFVVILLNLLIISFVAIFSTKLPEKIIIGMMIAIYFFLTIFANIFSLTIKPNYKTNVSHYEFNTKKLDNIYENKEDFFVTKDDFNQNKVNFSGQNLSNIFNIPNHIYNLVFIIANDQNKSENTYVSHKSWLKFAKENESKLIVKNSSNQEYVVLFNSYQDPSYYGKNSMYLFKKLHFEFNRDKTSSKLTTEFKNNTNEYGYQRFIENLENFLNDYNSISEIQNVFADIDSNIKNPNNRSQISKNYNLKIKQITNDIKSSFNENFKNNLLDFFINNTQFNKENFDLNDKKAEEALKYLQTITNQNSSFDEKLKAIKNISFFHKMYHNLLNTLIFKTIILNNDKYSKIRDWLIKNYNDFDDLHNPLSKEKVNSLYNLKPLSELKDLNVYTEKKVDMMPWYVVILVSIALIVSLSYGAKVIYSKSNITL